MTPTSCGNKGVNRRLPRRYGDDPFDLAEAVIPTLAAPQVRG